MKLHEFRLKSKNAWGVIDAAHRGEPHARYSLERFARYCYLYGTHAPEKECFGGHKVFLRSVIVNMMATAPVKMKKQECRELLWQAHQAGYLGLARFDLPAAEPWEYSTESEVSPPGLPHVTFHFLDLDVGSVRQLEV